MFNFLRRPAPAATTTPIKNILIKVDLVEPPTPRCPNRLCHPFVGCVTCGPRDVAYPAIYTTAFTIATSYEDSISPEDDAGQYTKEIRKALVAGEIKTEKTSNVQAILAAAMVPGKLEVHLMVRQALEVYRLGWHVVSERRERRTGTTREQQVGELNKVKMALGARFVLEGSALKRFMDKLLGGDSVA